MNTIAAVAIGAALGAWAGFRFGKAWQREGDKADAMLRRYRDEVDDDSDDYKPPAAGTVPPPLMARNAAPSPDPLPGPAPGRPVRAGPAVPGHACGPVTAALGFNEEGCIHIWHAATGCWVARKHAQSMPFDEAAWEAKLPGCGPRHGESLTEWERRIES